MGVANQVYLSTLKMRALARSVTTCQGCATLVSNLLYAPRVAGNNDASGAEHAWRQNYHRGCARRRRARCSRCPPQPRRAWTGPQPHAPATDHPCAHAPTRRATRIPVDPGARAGSTFKFTA